MQIFGARLQWEVRPRSHLTALLVTLGLVAAVAALTLRRGGVSAFDQQVVFGAALLMLAFVAASGWAGCSSAGVSWPVSFIALLPVLQLLPLGFLQPYLQSAFRQELAGRFAAGGVKPFSSASIYPYATAQSAVVAAGCCALFVLARALGWRSQRCLMLVVAGLTLLGFVEAIIGAQQYLKAQLVDSQGFLGAHGTFVNKNHFCAFLEGSFGLALGAVLGGLASGPTRRGSAKYAVWIGTAAVAVFCLLAGLFSFSRAGIIVLLLMLVAAARAAKPRGALVLVVVCVSAVAVAALAGFSGLQERFLHLVEEQGEAGRLSIWNDSLGVAQRYLWTGSGLGTFPFAFRREAMYLPRKTIDHAHSDFLEWLVELGLPATLLLLAGIVVVLTKTARRTQRIKDPLQRMVAFGAVLGACGILLHAAVDFPLQIPAVAALAAVLLGSASGAATSSSPQSAAPRWVVITGAIGFAGLAAFLAAGHAEKWNAERLYVRGEQAFASGRLAESENAWVDALEANPHAALAWLRRAELAEIQGRRTAAVEFAEIASSLEPFTLRVEWPVAQIHLRSGERAKGARSLAAVVKALPKMRRAVIQSAWGSGFSPGQIMGELLTCEGEGAADYLLFLAGRREWGQLAPSVRAFQKECGDVFPTFALDRLSDRLFEANQRAVLKDLRAALGHGAGEDDARSIREAETAQSHISVVRARVSEWVVRPVRGVIVKQQTSRSGEPFLEVEFRRPQNLYYRHLTYDFPVDPGRLYTLDAEIASRELRGSEGARLVVSTPGRYITSSKAVKRTTSWTRVRLRFRTSRGECVLRVAVVRNRSRRLNKLVSGSVLIRDVVLRTEPEPQTVQAEKLSCMFEAVRAWSSSGT